MDPDDEGGEGGPADAELPQPGADCGHRAWSFGVASEVLLRADVLMGALTSAQHAQIVAERCCQQCVAWTLSLQAQAHQALGEELAEQARRLNQPPPISMRRW